MWPLIQSGLLIFCTCILQLALVPHLSISGAKPDLVLIITALYGFAYGSSVGSLAGAVGGLFMDLFTGKAVGIGLLTKSIVGFFAGLVQRTVFVESIILPMLAVFVATIINESMYAAFIFLFGETTPVKPLFFEIILPEAFYNALLTPLIYAVVHRFLEFKQEDPAIRIASKAGQS